MQFEYISNNTHVSFAPVRGTLGFFFSFSSPIGYESSLATFKENGVPHQHNPAIVINRSISFLEQKQSRKMRREGDVAK